MSIQALRERKAALHKEANQLLAEKGDQVWSAEDQKTFDDLMDRITRVDSQVKAHQQMLEAAADQVADEHLRAKPGSKKSEAVQAFAKYLRTKPDQLSAEDAIQIRNAMSTTTPSEGGFTVPAEVASMVIDALKAYGGIREVAQIIPTEGGESWSFPASDGTAEEGEIVGENAPAAGGDITFSNVPLVVYKYSSKKIALPWELIADSAIDVIAFVLNRLATRIARITNRHYTNGTGTGQPFGLVPRATVGKTGTTGQTTSVIYDDLVDLVHSVNRAYRKNGRWSMADLSIRNIRKIKDTAGRPIFTPGYEYGITQDTPDLLLGKPITVNDDVPVMAANAKSIVFGDHSSYTIRDVMAPVVRRFDDSAFALNGQVGFCGWQRTGGNLMDVNAVKAYQNSAT